MTVVLAASARSFGLYLVLIPSIAVGSFSLSFLPSFLPRGEEENKRDSGPKGRTRAHRYNQVGTLSLGPLKTPPFPRGGPGSHPRGRQEDTGAFGLGHGGRRPPSRTPKSREVRIFQGHLKTCPQFFFYFFKHVGVIAPWTSPFGKMGGNVAFPRVENEGHTTR